MAVKMVRNVNLCTNALLPEFIVIWVAVVHHFLKSGSLAKKFWKHWATSADSSADSLSSIQLAYNQLMDQLIPLEASDHQTSFKGPHISCFSLLTVAASTGSCFETHLYPSTSFLCCVWLNQCHFSCHWCLLCFVPWWLFTTALSVSGFSCMHMGGWGCVLSLP